MSYYQPIEGRTMIIQVNADTGYSGDSLEWGDGQTGQYRVYWSYISGSGSYGGITGIDWPQDLQNTIYPLLDGLSTGSSTVEKINQVLYEYSGNRLFNQWDDYVEHYNANAVHCIRPA